MANKERPKDICPWGWWSGDIVVCTLEVRPCFHVKVCPEGYEIDFERTDDEPEEEYGYT